MSQYLLYVTATFLADSLLTGKWKQFAVTTEHCYNCSKLTTNHSADSVVI